MESYSEASALNRLQRNGFSKKRDKIISSNKKNVGIKLWGAVDYLCNYCGYFFTKS